MISVPVSFHWKEVSAGDKIFDNLNLTLYGIPPSKKNSKRIVRRKDGTPFIIGSKGHAHWEQEQRISILTVLRKYPTQLVFLPLQRAYIHIHFIPKDKRRHDLTNVAESVMDLLVNIGIIQDDNWNCIPELRLSVGDISKVPKTLITISTGRTD